MAPLSTSSLSSRFIRGFEFDRRRCSRKSQFHCNDILKPNSRLPQHSLTNFWSKSTIRLQSRQRLFTIVALSSTTSGGNSPEKKGDESTSDAAQGPPLLTILAGFVAFFLVCWIFGSIIMWLISLILIPPPSK